MDFSFDTYMTEYYRDLAARQIADGGSAADGIFAGNVFGGNMVTGNALSGLTISPYAVFSPYASFADALEKTLGEYRNVQEGEDVPGSTQENTDEMKQFLNNLRENIQKQYFYSALGTGYGNVGSPETENSSEPGQRENLASRLEKNRESRRQERIAGRYQEQSKAGKTAKSAAEDRIWRV